MESFNEEFCTALTRISLLGDGVVLGFSVAFLAAKTLYKYHRHSKILKKLIGTPVTNIADLQSPYVKRSNPSSNKFVIVRGCVHAESTIRRNDGKSGTNGVLIAENSGERAVVIQTTLTCLYNEWGGLLGWGSYLRELFGGSLKEQVTNSTRKVPFVLVQNNDKKNLWYAQISLDESKHLLPLTTVYHHLHPVHACPYSLLQAIFGCAYPVGLLDEEKILPPGKEITAIGHLSYRDNGCPVIKSCKWLPYFLSESTKDQLVSNITTRTSILFWSGIVLSTVAVGILGYAVLRNWHRWTEWRHRETEDQEDSTTRNGMDDESDWPNSELCVVCLSGERRYALIPCGHLVCCLRCSEILAHLDSNPRCPICRQDVHDSIRIYNS